MSRRARSACLSALLASLYVLCAAAVPATAQVDATVPENVTPPSIEGDPRIVLEADPGEWSGAPDAFAYRWLRDGEPIEGANQGRYVPVEADHGAALRVRVVASTAAGVSEPAVSAPLELPALPPADVAWRSGPPITDGLPGEVVHLSEDGDRMLRTSIDDGVALLDSSDPFDIEQLVLYPLNTGIAASVNSATFTPDGRYALAATEDGTGGSNRPGRITVLERGEHDELREVRRIPLPFQPDAIEVSDDGRFAAVAIEAERVGPGSVVIVKLADPADPDTWTTHEVPVELGPEYPQNLDPQPEYVDFNRFNEVAVSVQEQNAIMILDAEAAADADPATDPVVRVFSAGATDFADDGVLNDGRFEWSEATPNRVARQPDAVGWTADGQAIAAVAEGENTDPHEWVIYSRDGDLIYASGADMHRNAALFGQHPVNFRASQPEGLTVETYRGREYVFLVTERTANMSVYDITASLAAPRFVGTFPTGMRPETISFNPAKGFAVTGNETDEREPGSTLMALDPSDVDRHRPLLRGDEPWTNLRGLAATGAKTLYAVSSDIPHKLRRIDLSTPGEARMTTLATLPSPADQLGVEAVTSDGAGGVWIAGSTLPLMNVAADGALKRSIPSPVAAPTGIALTLDGEALVVIAANGSAHRVRLSDETVTSFTLTTTVPGQFTDLATAPDGRIMALRADTYNTANGPGETALVAFPADAGAGTVAAETVRTLGEDDQSRSASDRLTALAIAPNGDVWYAHGAQLNSVSGTDHGLRRLPGLLRPTVPEPRLAGLPSERNTFPYVGLNARLAGDELYAQGIPGSVVSRLSDPHGPHLITVDPRTGLPPDGATQQLDSPDAAVRSLSPDGEGGYYVAAPFGDQSFVRHVRTDGTLDAGFDPRINGPVNGVHFAGGRVWIGGGFTEVAGVPRARIAALRPDGSLDESVQIDASTTITLFEGTGDKVYVGSSSASLTLGGQARTRMGRIDTATATVDAFAPAPSSTVNAVAVDGARVILGGGFTTLGGAPAARLAVVDGTTGALVQDLNASGTVNSLAVAGRALWAGGSFSSVGGAPAQRLAALDLDDPSSVRALPADRAPDGTVALVQPLPDGGVLFSGSFTQVFGAARSGLAVLDGATLAPRAGVAGEMTTTSGGGATRALVLGADRVVLGGPFTILGRPGPDRALSKIDPATGRLDPRFAPPASFAPEQLATDADYLYGLDRPILQRVDRFTGELDEHWSVELNEACCDSAEVVPSGDRVFVSAWQLRGVNRTSRSGVAAIDGESGELLPFNPRPHGMVHGVAATPGGRVFVSGDFDALQGSRAVGIAEVDRRTGAPLDTFEGIELTVAAEEQKLFYDPERELLFAGGVGTLNGEPSGGLLAFDVSGERAQLVEGFDPKIADPDNIDDMVVVGDWLVINGRATSVNGTDVGFVYALDIDGELDLRFSPDRDVAIGLDSSGSRIAWHGELFEPAAPAVVTPPAVGGTPVQGSELTCDPGTWDAAPDRFEFRWLRDGVAAGTGPRYTPGAGDVGAALRCEVTAVNASGETLAQSPPVTVRSGAPEILTAPAVTGEPVAGRTLTADPGTWSGEPTAFSYQWLRDGTEISGATAADYVVAEDDRGRELAVRVTAGNAFGEASATSETVRVVAVPVNVVGPAIDGVAAVGEELSASPGSWAHEPTAFAYQWLRDGEPIDSAAGPTYVLVDDDEGTALAVRVTASNAAGSGKPAVSGGVEVPLPAAPVSTVRPAIEGAAVVGATVACRPGEFTGRGTIARAFEWRRDGAPIAGATDATYTIAGGDAGHALSCVDLATNKGGTTAAESAPVQVPPAAGGPSPQPGVPSADFAGLGAWLAPLVQGGRSSVSLEAPARARRGRAVRIRVRTDAALRQARLVLRRGNRTVVRAAARRIDAGGGRIRLQLSRRLVRGTYALRLIARDERDRRVVARGRLRVR